ncbi:ATP synthase subunit a [Clostridia bacterium]|nr:ATP synthase subunit a [Clostridia bacterium]
MESLIRTPNYVTLFHIGETPINFTETTAVELLVVLILGVLFVVLGRNLKIRPTGKRQMIAEIIVTFFQNFVRDGMGPKFKRFVPYIAAVFCFSLISNLMGLIGLRQPTADLSMVGTWGVLTFVLVLYTKIRTGGPAAPFTSLAQPVPVMTPFNIIGMFTNPGSQVIRHFGNIFAGMAISSLIYSAAGHFALIFPAFLSLYFDIFAAVVQAYIFTSLTMAYILDGDCSPEEA